MSSSRVLEQDLGSWLSSMGITDHFNSNDLQSGRTIASLLGSLNRENKIQLQEGSSAIVRVSNWNSIVQSLGRMGIKVTQQQKSKILNGNHDIIFRIISKLRELHQKSSKETQINLKDIDPKKQIKDASSLLQLFLLAIIKNFGLSAKESLSLLANDSKYLAHILAKGLKGQFKPIDAFIAQLAKQLPKILGFCRNQQNQSFFIKAIKPALISKSFSVADSTLVLVKTFLQNYELSQRKSLLKQHLLATLILVIRRHNTLVSETIDCMLGLSDYDIQILNEIAQGTGKKQLSSTLLSCWRAYNKEGKQQSLASSQAFQKMVSQMHNFLKDPQLVLGSLSFLVQMAYTNFDLFNGLSSYALAQNFGQIAPLKDSDTCVFIHLSAALLKICGNQKHPIAPMLFKFLTGKLTSAPTEEYEIVIKNLTQIIQEIPSIPPLHIMEQLSQRSDISIGQLQLSLFNKVLQLSPQVKSGVAIYNLASRSLVEQLGFGMNLSDILTRIISNFHQQQIVVDMTSKLVKVCLAIYFANIKKLTGHRKPLSLKNKIDPEEVSAKLKLIQIQYFIRKIIAINDSEINNNIQPLICFSYIQISSLNKQQNKQFYKGLEKIVEMFGNLNDLLGKYQVQFTGNQSMVQSKVSKLSPKNNQLDSLYQQTQDSGMDSLKQSKRVKSSHPVSLNLTNVKPDAYSGLQKYMKLHQTKILAAQSKRYQALQAIEDQKKSKKIHQKKIMLENNMRIKSVSENQLRYLFQFDSKQVYAQANNLNMNFYSNQGQQQRDTAGLQNLLKRYEKALRVYFTIYSGQKTGSMLKNFDQYSDKKSYVHSSGIAKMLKQHGLDSYISARQIKFLIRKVNYKLDKIRDDPETLDFDAFKDFVLQMAFTMYTRPPKDLRGHPVAEMLEQLFSNLKAYATQNRISPQIFQEPQACFANQAEAVKVLNRKLKSNPDYILPQGYKKITQKKVTYDYQIYLEAMSITYKEVYEVVDWLLYNAFKIHLIEPFVKQQNLVTARPNIYHLQRNKYAETVYQKHIPVSLKKQVAKAPIMDRIIARDAAYALAQIIQAVQLEHDEVGVKHQNPRQRQIKQKVKQEQTLKDLQAQKMLMYKSQLKETMGEYKTKRQNVQQQKKQKANQQSEKLKQDKQRKERRNQQLKKKVEQYLQRKKEDQEAKKASQQSKIQKDKQQLQRKKRENDEKKNQIAQKKKQKEIEQKERKDKEKQQQKRKKLQNKKKYEQEQKEKKRKIQQFKNRTKSPSKVMDAPAEQQGEQQNQNAD